MSTGPRHPHRVAALAAIRVAGELAPACERIEVVGSVRRGEKEVGDVELLVIPKLAPGPPAELFGPPTQVNLLENRVAELLAAGVLARHPSDPKNGPKYKKLWLPRPCYLDGARCVSHPGGCGVPRGIQVDLFIVTRETWGPAHLVRTGPAEFSQAMVTRLHGVGLRCDELQIKNLQGHVVECPDEKAFFRLVKRPYLPPEMR